MTSSKIPNSKILNLRLALINYPILADKIRHEMRQELFKNKIVDPDVLEAEVEQKAIRSQAREGLLDPLHQETAEIWETRLNRIRDYLTDFYFAYNLPYSRFEELVSDAVNANRAAGQHKKINLTFNPELSPWYLLFEQAEKYETYPPELYAEVQHNLKQIIVVLIKSLVSGQMEFVHIARDFLSVFDLKTIKSKKIGPGKVGGKAAGMILAYKILTRSDPEDEINLAPYIGIPDTYYVGSDVYYDFKARNKFEYTVSQKYRSRYQIEEEYPQIRDAYLQGSFPEETLERLRKLLDEVGGSPIIVRSSSLLEDNFGYAFAGKYESYFLPNQGTLEENLQALTEAIIRIYSSVLSPDALFYRQIQGLEDYDERMAILIQKVQGQRHGRYFFPFVAGVGFSRNPFIWNKKLKPEDGFVRIVLGLGTRAVDRVDRDYPRMVGLSHPQLRPVKNAADIVRYSQRSIDLIDLVDNSCKSVPASEVMNYELEGLQYLASLDEGDYVKPIFSLGSSLETERLVLTFDNLLKNTDFVKLMKAILKKLERYYNRPVDVEFTVELIPKYPKPELKIYLLQCRPLSNQDWFADIQIPQSVAPQDELFHSTHLVPQGLVEKVRYIIYIDPLRYGRIPNSVRIELTRIIGKLNQLLEGESFILMGPGRWGSSNIDLGVRVSYADIYNARMLIEIAMSRNGATPEVSYGTHFFQDLVESRIFPLALYPNTDQSRFNQSFIDTANNKLATLMPEYSVYGGELKVIDLPEVSQGRYLRVVMSSEEGQALGYLTVY